MTQFCNPAKKPRVEAMTNETCLPGTLSAIMESDEDREMGKSGDAVESDGGSAEGEKEAPKKPLTEAERVVRGILWGLYRQATRWDRKYDFNANPHSAPESNVFDTHCHIDRLFGPKLYHEWFPYFRKNIVTKSRGAYYAKFEGCITNFCDLDFIEVFMNTLSEMSSSEKYAFFCLGSTHEPAAIGKWHLCFHRLSPSWCPKLQRIRC